MGRKIKSFFSFWTTFSHFLWTLLSNILFQVQIRHMKHHAVHSQILLQKLFENKLCLSADAKSEMSENITS